MIFQKFLDDGNGNVSGIQTVLVEWKKDATGRWQMAEIPGEFPENTGYSPNAVSMLGQRGRRWANIETALGQLFAEL